MSRRSSLLTAFLVLLLTTSTVSPAIALDEADRLWLVGERASADGLDLLARRTLERFVERYPDDPRAARATMLLGKARLRLGDLEPALESFRTAQKLGSAAAALEARFWEGETLFRLKRYADASAAYEEVQRNDVAGALKPDAVYGYGWAELELRHRDRAVGAFRNFLQGWPEHQLAPSATYQLARGLAENKTYGEALSLLTGFAAKYPGHKLVPDAQYLLGWTRLAAGETKAGLADLRAFVEKYPTHELVPEARTLATQAALKSGDKGQLAETYESLMAQKPPTAEALVEAFTLATKLGNVRDRDAAWRRLRTEFPAHSLTQRTALDLGTAAFKRKDWKEAASFAEVAAQTRDDTMRAEAWLLAGESELKLRHFAPAAKAFESVGAVDKVEPGVRYRALAGLGLAREEQKELRAALSAYEAVGAKSPDPALREWARERATAVKSRLAKPPVAPPAAKPKAKS